MIDENEIMALIKNFVQTKEGQDWLKEQNINVAPFDKDEMIQLANQLKNDIINAFLSIVQDPEKEFKANLVRVYPPKVNKNNQWHLTISFGQKALFRPSLYNWDSENQQDTFTGSGVYDIFGLFTQGYVSKPVYGDWVKDNGHGDWDEVAHNIRSKTARAANSFITDTINAFKKEHPLIEVEYPKEWGGTK